jgi:hypothetical protein
LSQLLKTTINRKGLNVLKGPNLRDIYRAKPLFREPFEYFAYFAVQPCILYFVAQQCLYFFPEPHGQLSLRPIWSLLT